MSFAPITDVRAASYRVPTERPESDGTLEVALWDLKAKLLGVCLADLLGRAHEAVPVYGSGGLTSYGCALGRLRHCEYFHTHARVERLLFDGVLEPRDGCLIPDPGRPGLGIELKRVDAEQYRA